MAEPDEETIEAMADALDLSSDEVRARLRQHGASELERLQERAREQRVRWIEEYGEDWLEHGGEG